jgi:3',5'-cyclic AMP phosphodiesterase CpdA
VTTLVHLSDLHFGGLADIRAVEAVEELLPSLQPTAIIISGDFAQRARAGEFQRGRAFFRSIARLAPVHAIAGNHDVQWWREPFGIPLLGRARFAKYRRYVGDDLAPALTVDGAVICGAATAHGLSWGSVTWNPRDLTVKGHLPKAALARAASVFAGANGAAPIKVLVVHHNVLKGRISRRWGLARPMAAMHGIVASGADVVCCGHDHEEGIGTIELDGRRVIVSTAGTLSTRGRDHRAPSFNLLRATPTGIRVEIHALDRASGSYRVIEGRDFDR